MSRIAYFLALSLVWASGAIFIASCWRFSNSVSYPFPSLVLCMAMAVGIAAGGRLVVAKNLGSDRETLRRWLPRTAIGHGALTLIAIQALVMAAGPLDLSVEGVGKVILALTAVLVTALPFSSCLWLGVTRSPYRPQQVAIASVVGVFLGGAIIVLSQHAIPASSLFLVGGLAALTGGALFSLGLGGQNGAWKEFYMAGLISILLLVILLIDTLTSFGFPSARS